MRQKEIIVPIYLKSGRAVRGLKDETVFSDGDTVSLARQYSNQGADAILFFDLSRGDKEHEQSLGVLKEITRAVDIPVYGGGNIFRMEDVKKLIYAGCRKVFLNYGKPSSEELTDEASARFGRDKMLACVSSQEELAGAFAKGELLDGILCMYPSIGEPAVREGKRLYFIGDGLSCEQAAKWLNRDDGAGICLGAFMQPDFDFMSWKHTLAGLGISVNLYESSLSWEEIKVNKEGLLPVVVQDYKTQEVLMMAYMNREAFETTVRTGKMTYWSRSRQELWVKGMTSGHFQYVKELRIDCDNDTLLAKVHQIEAACHTGNRTCFYRTILKKEYEETNPLKVFEEVFSVIEDRKKHPKEGSYTNYLFEKGIDKILKKVGEEATEIVIAAKNPDPEEIKYEISDFLYHVMVLMAEKEVTWTDITRELAQR